MEIEVGEYVRLARNQGINRIIEIEDKRYILDTDIADEFGDNTCVLEEYQLKDEVLDHNKNIIDLVEVGDYVNGHLVVEISKNVYNQKLVITEVDGKDGAIRHHYLERSIKTVVTHEQFASIEYKVEE